MGGCSIIFTLPLNPFFLLLYLSYLLSTSADFSPNCSQSQFCGNLSISYPFFNYNKNRGCGLEHLQCRNGSITVISSGNEDVDGGTMYEVQSIDYSKRILKVHDLRFTQADWLNDNDKCKFLFNNFTSMPPIFHHLSAQLISPNHTLQVCKNHFQRLKDGPHLGVSDEYCTVKDITDEPDAHAPPPSRHGFPHECKVVHLPVDVPAFKFHGPVYHISELYTVGFRLRWNLPKQCLQCEKNRTGCVWQSFHQDKENFSCFDPNKTWNQEKGHKNQRKIIGIGISVGTAAGFLLSCLLFFTFCKYRTGHTPGRVRSFSLKTDLGKGSAHFRVPIFSYVELEEATNNFSSANELGDGGFSTVYHGKLRDGRVVAIKRLYHNDYKHVERFMNEIEIITRLHHQNLVTLYGCTSYRSRELLLVYELIPNGTVADHIHGEKRQVGSLPWPVRMSIAMEAASALSYLHASDIIHRDVKTSNILLDNHFHVKVADFGLCRLLPSDVSHVSTFPQGTPGYVDPDYHRCYKLTDKSDVYSFGVVLIELISSKPAVDISRHWDEINLANMAMNKIQKGALQELVDPCLGFELDYATRRMVTLVAELAFRCLQQEKELRPSMDEVLEILTEIGVDQDYKVDNDVGLLKNTPPPPQASPNSGSTAKSVTQPTMPSTTV